MHRYTASQTNKAALRKQALDVDADWLDWDNTPYVACDIPCFALREPKTLEQYKAALLHWRKHHLLYGCSHGR